MFTARNIEYHKTIPPHVTERLAPNVLGAFNATVENCIELFVQRRTELAKELRFMAKGKDIKGIVTGNDNGFHVGVFFGSYRG